MLSMVGYDFNHGLVTDALTVYYLWSRELELRLIKSKLSENMTGLYAFWPARLETRPCHGIHCLVIRYGHCKYAVKKNY